MRRLLGLIVFITLLLTLVPVRFLGGLSGSQTGTPRPMEAVAPATFDGDEAAFCSRPCAGPTIEP